MCLSCLTKKNTLIILLVLIFFSLIFDKTNLNNNQLKKNNPLSLTPTSLTSPNVDLKKATASAEVFRVKKVIDGDTITLENGRKVRYIGIDTPELHDPRKKVECFAKEAYLENKKLVEGKSVRLEKDVSEVDRYNRLLRYVYLIDNMDNNATGSGLFVNQYLVQEGFAFASSFPPDVKYSSLLLQSQKEAQEKNKGLWKNCPLRQ